jgi:hypothetical protein
LDNDYSIDLDEVKKTIGTAEVVVIRFPTLTKRLLLDSRSNDREGPLIALVGRAQSAEERFRSLKQLRPSFPLPERIMSVSWPKSVQALARTGVWAAIEDRCGRAGHPGAVEACANAFEALLGEERAELEAALTGSGYRTIWQQTKDE